MINNQENCLVPREDCCHYCLQGIHEGLVIPQGPGPGYSLTLVAVESKIS